VGFSGVCPTGYAGRFCRGLATDVTQAKLCPNFSCKNGGVCTVEWYRAYCKCPAGTFGKYCQFKDGITPRPGCSYYGITNLLIGAQQRGFKMGTCEFAYKAIGYSHAMGCTPVGQTAVLCERSVSKYGCDVGDSPICQLVADQGECNIGLFAPCAKKALIKVAGMTLPYPDKCNLVHAPLIACAQSARCATLVFSECFEAQKKQCTLPEICKTALAGNEQWTAQKSGEPAIDDNSNQINNNRNNKVPASVVFVSCVMAFIVAALIVVAIVIRRHRTSSSATPLLLEEMSETSI
jgi:hypothetical protein